LNARDAEHTLPRHFPNSAPPREPKTQKTSQLQDFEGENRRRRTRKRHVNCKRGSGMVLPWENVQKQSRPLFGVRDEGRRCCAGGREGERAMRGRGQTAGVTRTGCSRCVCYLPLSVINLALLVDHGSLSCNL
jgi:hypothetical protein